MNKSKLTKRAKRKGYTLKKLADALGISPPTLTRKLNGERPMTVDECAKIAELLGLTMAQVIEYKEAQR